MALTCETACDEVSASHPVTLDEEFLVIMDDDGEPLLYKVPEYPPLL